MIQFKDPVSVRAAPGDLVLPAAGETVDYITLPSDRLSTNHCAGKKREFRFHPIKEAVMEEPADITPWLDQLDDTMKEKVQQLQKTR